ncbi:MAG: helix-turn-helix transcriptional regulator [Deltaproteobacteria bacterium]|nr:helix-turn-helix transcriptional regulator [Deltaproteobacteria bacterium]
MQTEVVVIRLMEGDGASWGVMVKLKEIRLGDEHLTDAERAVAGLIAEGLSNAEIATARGTSTRTIANQVANILAKLSVDSRVDLVAQLLGRAT